MRAVSIDKPLTRRGLVAVGLGLLVLPRAVLAATATPAQTAGPFYPRAKPTDSDMDLTVVAGRPGRAKGDAITVTGRVFNLAGAPIDGAEVEIWQADWRGHYHHPADRGAEPPDPDFQGFGTVRTGADGAYRFRTIMPLFYGQGFGQRTRHIHYRVVGPRTREFITQMYFPGEAMNERDGVFRSLNPAERVAVTSRRTSGEVPNYEFALVLG
jgi:protocatechuate 3,4-dioxygenase, beta subunit